MIICYKSFVLSLLWCLFVLQTFWRCSRIVMIVLFDMWLEMCVSMFLESCSYSN